MLWLLMATEIACSALPSQRGMTTADKAPPHVAAHALCLLKLTLACSAHKLDATANSAADFLHRYGSRMTESFTIDFGSGPFATASSSSSRSSWSSFCETNAAAS